MNDLKLSAAELEHLEVLFNICEPESELGQTQLKVLNHFKSASIQLKDGETFVSMCTNPSLIPENDRQYFTKGGVYRSIVVIDEGFTYIMVNGMMFDVPAFNDSFIDHTPTVKERLSQYTLLQDNGKMITKKAFKEEFADVHQYGRGRGKRQIVYIGVKDNRFAFKTPQGTTKAKAISLAYDHLKQLLDGNLDILVQGWVNWFYRGTPISYPNSEYNGLKK